MDSEHLVCSSLARLYCESYSDTLSWSKRIHQSQGDCLISSQVSSLPEKPYTDLTQNRLSDLATLWEQFSISKKKRFRDIYGDIASLILVPVEEPLLRAVMRFWDPSYRCFTFGKNDLVPTVEEYSILIGVELQHPDKVYNQKSRAGWRKTLTQILKVQPRLSILTQSRRAIDRVYHGMFYKISFESIYMMNMVWWLSLQPFMD